MGATRHHGKRPRGDAAATAAAKRRRRYSQQQRQQQQQQQQQQATATTTTSAAARMPACVQQLYTSHSCAALHEACADIAVFALQSSHHAQLTQPGVVARLAQLLLLAQPPAAEHDSDQHDADRHDEHDDDDDDDDSATSWLRLRTAAAEALRNLITSSRNDEVVDVLMSLADNDNSNSSDATMRHGDAVAALARDGVAHALCVTCTTTWRDALTAVATATTSAPYTTALLRFATELLQLLVVCVEGSGACADAFSSREAVRTLLALLEYAYTTVVTAQQQQQRHDENNDRSSSTTRMRVSLLASVCVAASDVLAVLSSDNAALARVLRGDDNDNDNSDHDRRLRDFLDRVVAADDVQQWLCAQQQGSGDGDRAVNDALQQQQQPQHDNDNDDEQASSADAHDAVAALVERDGVWCQLLQSTLSVQTTLLHVCTSSAHGEATAAVTSSDSLCRVLPLLTRTLQTWQPMALWRRVLPLLSHDCALDEAVRAAAVALYTSRLRSVHVALRLLHAVVTCVCEHNDSDLDDEAAFAGNAQRALLYTHDTLAVFARVLQDVLWVRHDDSNGGDKANAVAADVVLAMRQQQQQQQQQAALRGATSRNAEVTTLQFLLLSIEVAVWDVASTLLVMVPVSQLGDAAHTWRAMVTALLHRYRLLVDAAAADASSNDSDNTVKDAATTATDVVHSIAAHSMAARQLLWLQAESLTQMLWTLQRKQARACGGPLQTHNTLAAVPSDVDVLTRLSWQHAATPTLRQACVGAVGLLCCSLRSAEATAVAARYARALLLAPDSSSNSNNDNNDGSHKDDDDDANKVLLDVAVCDAMPSSLPPSSSSTQHIVARHAAAWLAWRRRLAAADALACVRCEAANTLIDLFLDERYDASVYAPLRVHRALRLFLRQLQQYRARRARVTRRCAQLREHHHRHHHDKHNSSNSSSSSSAHDDVDVDVAPDAAAELQWDELASNLDGFVAYKAAHHADGDHGAAAA